MRTKILCAFFFALLFAVTSDAQICPGSHLTYFVRDSKGKLINADASGVTFTGTGEGTYGEWIVGDISKPYLTGRVKLPAALATFWKTGKVFSAGGMCNFRGQPTTLKVTIKGKTMALTFKFPPTKSDYDSGIFGIDSLPFKAGKYEIDLTTATDATGYRDYGGYFAASFWKKVP